MLNDITIEHFTIGEKYKPFVIAEMSGNHNQSLERALTIIDAASAAGAHAIKLQTFLKILYVFLFFAFLVLIFVQIKMHLKNEMLHLIKLKLF